MRVYQALIVSALISSTATLSCGGASGIGDGDTGSLGLSLTAGSCPVSDVIQSMELTLQQSGPPTLTAQVVERSDVDAHCGAPSDPLFDLLVPPGEYEWSVLAFGAPGGRQFDAAGQLVNPIINDIESASGTILIEAGQTAALSALIRPAVGRVTGSDGIDIDNAAFESSGFPLPLQGCCCPTLDSSCTGLTQVDCFRATRSGLCSGWQVPCGC